MAEQVATRKKSKAKNIRVIDDVIPDLPDLSDLPDLNILDSQEVKSETPQYDHKLENISVTPEQVAGMQEIEEVSQTDPMSGIDIGILYPSLSKCCVDSITINQMRDSIVDERNSLDVVTVRLTRPAVPMAEWRLPEPMGEREIRMYYQNALLDSLDCLQTRFIGEMQSQDPHPLVQLIEAYQRSIRNLTETELRLRQMRDLCVASEPSLWRIDARNAVKEAKCGDNAIIKRTYAFDEATFNADQAGKLGALLTELVDLAIDEHSLCKYEVGLNRQLVENFLAGVVANVRDNGPIRTALTVLFRFLRQTPGHNEVLRSIHDWITFLGHELAANRTVEDRLYLLWQLLHAPAGLTEWGAPALLQIGRDEVELAITCLAMLLGSRKMRDQFLEAWNPGLNREEAGWALVDSDGEDDDSIGHSWSLLRESDLIAFLGQIPIARIFQAALDVPLANGQQLEIDNYDPTRGCHPNRLLTMMAFCMRIMAILDAGLDVYHQNRYKALNKRISRIIKHTIQILTDHLEIVLSWSALPQFDQLFPGNCRIEMLAQYELVYEYLLKSILRHRRHGNCQNLVDISWRMLSPHKKWSFLTFLIDASQSEVPTDNDWFLTNLQLAIDQMNQDDTIYLLTAISNLALESRPVINSELLLLTTITKLLFQICYVIPATRSSFSKVGRELLSSISLQHPQALSIILEATKLWHPTVGQMGLFLFRDLPFCLMMPSDAEFKLLSSWLLDNPPNHVCNQLARHVFSNLNWGFANTDETVIYLPLSLHQRMATLLMSSFKKHAMDNKSGNWFVNESIKLVTYLWWNQEPNQDQSFHAWCLSLSIRLRLHPSTRTKVVDPEYLKPSSITNTSEWLQPISDAQQERCSHPIAMYMAVTTNNDSYVADVNMLKIIQNLVVRHQQYRLCLELISQIITNSTTNQTSLLLGCEIFMNVWKLIVHADDTYYNMVKNLITKQFPGPVLSCIGNSFCPSLVIANGSKVQQESIMKFFINSITNQINWYTDQSFLWLLDKLLELNTALYLQAGSEELYTVVKQFTEKQFSDASKRSGLAQIFRLGTTFNSLINQMGPGNFMWLKSYILEAQVLVENEMGLWSELLFRFSVKKKREYRTVTSAINSVYKHLRLSLSININSFVIIQSAQVLASCQPDNMALIKIAVIFFQRYLGFARLWNKDLVGHGSVGHRMFQDDLCHPFLQQARDAILAAKNYHLSQLDSIRQSSPSNILLIDQTQKLCEKLEMLLLWIDEPKLHVEDMPVLNLPAQYRPDLLNLVRQANITVESFDFPRRILLEQSRQAASGWNTRHDLDFRFVRMANSIFSKPTTPLVTKILQRFKRQTSCSTLDLPNNIQYQPIIIPSQALANITQILEFISGPLSSMYQSAAKHKANKNFLADLNKKYLAALPRQYEGQPVTQNFQIPCNKGAQLCTSHAVINLNYTTWVKRPDVTSEIARNRQDYNKLVDEMLQFSNLDRVVQGVLCLQHLIMSLEAQLQSCQNNDKIKVIIDCGLALFYYLGRQINSETQKYPPHHIFVSNSMNSIGSKFLCRAADQASVLLKGMLENELLVEVYGPHFCPNSDTSQTADMYLEVIQSYESGKCKQKIVLSILSKFNIKQFLESSPNLLSKLAMMDVLCTAIGNANPDKSRQLEIDINLEEINGTNFVALLSFDFAVFLPRVMTSFASMCDDGKLGVRFWDLVLECFSSNITEHNELVLNIDEIRMELETIGAWLNKSRFSDTRCKKNGLFCKYGPHSVYIVKICGQLLEALTFKLARSATENICSWHEVVEKSWDLFLKVYIPWIQSFYTCENSEQGELRLPWLMEDREIAENLMEIAVEHLNIIVSRITNKDARSYLLHCVLIWIANGLLVVKELPAMPYHHIYCLKFALIKWELLPTMECMKLIVEFTSRTWISEQCKTLFINIASQMRWMDVVNPIESDFAAQMFQLVVTFICKTKSVFKILAIEKLVDVLVDLNWDQLQTSVYRHGMDQLVSNLEPRIILCNPSTIEGKIIKYLNHAAGSVMQNNENSMIDMTINKQKIYVNVVVKLLSIAFSFTQSKNSKTKTSSGDDNQVKLFQLRITGLFSEMENVVMQISDRESSEKMAMALLTEVSQLFKNPHISILAIEPVISWLQESKSSPIILPFLVTLYQSGSHISSIVSLSEELIEAFILSDKSDGGPTSWSTINACVRINVEFQQQYWKECIKQNSIMCLVQQILVSMQSANPDQWQNRIVDCLEQIRPQRIINEQSTILIIFFYLQLLLSAAQNSPRPSSAFKNFIQFLLKVSESKTSSGFLGKVGLGKKSNLSFEFRMSCRSLSVFLHVQLPSNNLFRIHSNDPGGVTHPDMTITSRTIGEALPTNKTLQHLDWLKSQRSSKELTATSKSVLDSNISFICNPIHCIFDSTNFLRTMCRQLWPDCKLFNLIY